MSATDCKDFAPFAFAIAISFFMFGRRYERWKSARDNDAANRIRAKYQAHISRPSQTSKQ